MSSPDLDELIGAVQAVASDLGQSKNGEGARADNEWNE